MSRAKEDCYFLKEQIFSNKKKKGEEGERKSLSRSIKAKPEAEFAVH